MRDEFNQNNEPIMPNPDTDLPSDEDVSSAEPTQSNPLSVRHSAPTGEVYRKETYAPPPPPLAHESAARVRMRRRRVKDRRGGEWAWVVIAAAMLGVAVTISLSIFMLLRVTGEGQEVMPTAPVVSILPTSVDARSDFTNSGGDGGAILGEVLTLPDGQNIILEPWDGQSRFTILVVGLDRRPGETGIGYRTDTMLLVSIDPATQNAGILSIPRDLYVEVPGYAQLQRVNSPMVLGERRRAGYGPQLAMQTVQWNLGMRVHDYLAVDFNAFIAVVDAIGGIDLEVEHAISDPLYPDMYYGYDPFSIAAGLQHLDGATALKYARTRHGSSDFERAERQQQVLFAIRDRVLSLDMLPSLILQAPSLWGTLSENVYTGLTLEQVVQLALYAKDIPLENFSTGVISNQYVINYMTQNNEAVLIPNRSRLGGLMVEVFGANYSE